MIGKDGTDWPSQSASEDGSSSTDGPESVSLSVTTGEALKIRLA